MKRIKTGFLLILCLMMAAARPVCAASAAGTQGKNILVLHNPDGTEYTRITSSHRKFTLPTMAAREGYTFLGWSKKKGTGKDPDYEAGDKVWLSGTLHLYAVYFKRSSEADLDVSGLTSGYDKVIFVGDSRTRGLQLALTWEYGENGLENIAFVARNGSGLDWLKKTGIKRLQKLIRQELKKNKKARIAVVFNHGVNDLKHKNGSSVDVSGVAKKYASYMLKIAKKLKKEGCDLYYLSVNPVNSGKHATATLRKGEEIRSFNAQLKKKLQGQYTFLDCYSWLVENGYSTRCLLSAKTVKSRIVYKDDGVHYTTRTYKRIYAYCMKYLKAGARSR